jgi:hypothetical protein
VLSDELPAELFGEVFEVWVGGSDEVQFLLSTPAFELLFASDGGADVVVLFDLTPKFLAAAHLAH